MTTSLQSLIQSGTKLWLDSIDPDLIQQSRADGVTGATSNPVIVSDLIRSGRFDALIHSLIQAGQTDGQIAWAVTDGLIRGAQQFFQPVWEETHGDDGYVSFEVDPLLEDLQLGPPHHERVEQYIALAKKWSEGHQNRMIKIPATGAGIASLEELAAFGVTLNVTLIFTARQYREAREAVWRGAQRRSSLDSFKSVYSIFVSRVDAYTHKRIPELSPEAQGMVGITGARQIWRENKQFWADKGLPLAQEIIFASTGTKLPDDPPWLYIDALAGSDIQTNPPATNDAIRTSERIFSRQIDQLPPQSVLDEIDRLVDLELMEKTLMSEGLKKFADPQKELLALIARMRL